MNEQTRDRLLLTLAAVVYDLAEKTESRTMPTRCVGTLNTRVDIFLKVYYRCDVCHWEWYPPDAFRESENRKSQKKEQHHAQP